MDATTQEFIAHAAARAAPPGPDGAPAWDRLAALAEERWFEAGRVLTRQFEPAADLFLVAEGAVRFQNRIEEGNEEIDVGGSRAAWTPVGWSGLVAPRRYATTVVCESACRTLRFGHRALDALCADDPALGARFLETVLGGCLDVLAAARARIVRHSRTPVNFGQSLDEKGEEEAYNRAPPPVIELFRRSPFFEALEEAQLRRLAEAVESRYFCRGEPVVEQGSCDPGIWVLATGRVALNYRPAGAKEAFALRTIASPGAVVAVAGVAGVEAVQTSVRAMRDCTVYRIDPSRFDPPPGRDPRLALALVRRLLWLAAGLLRASRAIFISRRFAQERLAIRNLIEQSCTQLAVNSPLHRLPHLLDSHLTLGDAFASLDRMEESPDALERSLAQLCRDLLGEVQREHEFFEALRQVYHAVVTAPPEMPAAEVRKLCARGFREAFSRIRYVIEGERHLPDAPGQIFVFNHLKNHEYNTLPNNFQLTLDSHFVSAMILDPRYGDSGIRVVRHSRGAEYGHQAYYDRLGHVAVYTHESDRIAETEQQRRTRRSRFFDAAGRRLQAGANLILSPEGTSFWTEDSPGPFKPGAFRLAASVRPEPWIVPIAVANFDRRVHSTVCAAVVKPPFKVSDALPDPNDRDRLTRFLIRVRETFASYVEEARRLARAAEQRARRR